MTRTTGGASVGGPDGEGGAATLLLVCPRCRYDRRGLERGVACPECGSAAPVFRAASVCIGCGYLLHGLPEGTACPECRTPMDASRPGGTLIGRPVAYLERVRLGALLAHLGVLGAVVGGVLFVVGVVVMGFAGFAGGGLLVGVALAAAPIAGGAAYLGLTTLGWWWVTTRDPAPAPWEDPGRALAVCVRVTSVGCVVAALATLGVELVEWLLFSASGSAVPAAAVTATVQLAGFALWFACEVTRFVTGTLFIAELGRRMAHVKLTRMARFRVWFCPVVAVVGVVACYVGPLVALILYYNLLVKLRGGVRDVLAMRPAA